MADKALSKDKDKDAFPREKVVDGRLFLRLSLFTKINGWKSTTN